MSITIDASAAPFDSQLKKLMMPGPLIEGHSQYENDCSNCHENFNGASQPKLCLDCHEDIAKDIGNRSGMHGHFTENQQQNCKTCHTDHRGRDANITGLDRDHFDHGQTDFQLTGQHLTTQCNACHKENKTFREAPTACFDCHENNDIHRQNLGKACGDCHTPQEWTKNTFDHANTDFALKGKHQHVSCGSCHPDQRYTDTPSTCVTCHQSSDVHLGTHGQQCDKCHQESDWKKTRFDHNKNTDFPLTGKHQNAECSSCHKQNMMTKKPPSSCVGCHKTDDIHGGNRGKQCQDCHTTNTWKKTTFNHNQDTDFPLQGAHTELICESCHRNKDMSQNKGNRCIDCHRDSDVHQGGLGDNCQQCHNAEQWLDNIRFNHDLTRFPLVGMHALSSCSNCHVDNQYQNLSTRCSNCHEHNDVHQQSMGSACQDCHNPNGWNLWIFDHARQTDFALEGAHENLACEKCHSSPRNDNHNRARTSCYKCHQNDDIHRRQFGTDCGQCHSMNSFREVRMGRQ